MNKESYKTLKTASKVFIVKEKLVTQLREMLDSLTYDKLLESQAAEAGNMTTILKTVPIPLGKCITIG